MNIDNFIESMYKKNITTVMLNNVINPINTMFKLLQNNSQLNNEQFVNIIYEFLYSTNYIYKTIGLMNLVSDYNLIDIDKRIEQYISLFYTNNDIQKRIQQIYENNNNYILKKILIDFDKLNDELLKKIEKKVQNLENLLNNGTMNNYLYLMCNENNRTKRDKIYTEYTKNVNVNDKIMKLFIDIIIERNNYAVSKNHNVYFELVKPLSKKESDAIKFMLNDLINRIDIISRNELINIKSQMNEKLQQHDIINHCSNQKKKIFEIETVMKLLIKYTNKYFGLIIKETEQTLWNKNIIVYEIFNKNNISFGFIYFDLMKNKTKKINNPLCIHLSQRYMDLKHIEHYTKIAIIAGFTKNQINENDVLNLFKEFGIALQLMINNINDSGILIDNYELSILMSHIFEYIAINEFNITKHCLAHTIKIKCINSLFDHIIHNSKSFTDNLKQNTNKKNIETIKLLYKNVFSNVMNSQKNIINTDINWIEPDLIQKELTTPGLLYSNILIDILSYGIYYLLKIKGKEVSNEFIQLIMETKPDKIRKGLNNLISKYNIESYTIFIEHMMK